MKLSYVLLSLFRAGRMGGLFACVVCLLAVAGPARGQYVSDPLLTALEALRQGKATPGQRALLFQNNGLLNNARLNGWICDPHYQAMQSDYAHVNQTHAKAAAEAAGAEFHVQKRTSSGFSPGTDSDYIVKVTSKDPVGQIKAIQANYDKLVNAWREKCLRAEGMEFKPYREWYKKLDVDFMADPKTVTAEQFKAIKELNNGAYANRDAAEYERITRLGAGEQVGSAEVTGYAKEMLGQIAKKQRQMERFRANPSLMNDPFERGEMQKLMAMEQKYVERLETMAERLRNQERLQHPAPFKRPEIKVTLKDGRYVFQQEPVSVAAKGALRKPGNFGTSAIGSALTRNSISRGIADLADALAEAAVKNPKKWPGAAKNIAEITAELAPSEKGAILERLVRRETRGGKAMARDVAVEMRRQDMAAKAPASRLAQLDAGLRGAFGVTEGLSEMGQARQAFNKMAQKALGGLDRINKTMVAVQVASALKDGRDYAFYIAMATDPATPDAQANEAFRKAQEAANRLTTTGMMGVVFTKVPTLGAVYMAGSFGYDGTRWILENTETGQVIDRTVTDFFDQGIQNAEITYDKVLAYFGGEGAGADPQQAIDAAWIKAFQTGKQKLVPGATVKEFIAALHKGDKALMTKMLVQATPAVRNTDNQGYVAWTNDVGWIHVGTIESFRKPSAKGSEIWGGLSRDPMTYSVLLGGKSFETFDDAVRAIAPVIGPGVVRKNAALASPSVYYKSGEQMVGFEIVRHPSFKGYIEAADRRTGS